MLRNPPWTRDELILALDLYFRVPPSSVNVQHPEIVALSNLLNKLPIHSERPDPSTFRNANGVHMKMFNFQSLDPDRPGGLSAGSALDREIWNEFSSDKIRLARTASAIRELVSAGVGASENIAVNLDEDTEAIEGAVLFRTHRARERSAQLIRRKKESVKLATGTLACEVCGFDFFKVYGELGKDFCECHHTTPLSQLAPNQKTRLVDLAIVCANCHRMLHRKSVLSIQQLHAVISRA